jgi:integrase
LKAGRIIRDVATLVDPPAKARSELHPMTLDQALHFLAATADDRSGPLYSLAIATGMRQGELLALRWRDVDLDGGWLAVRPTLQQRVRKLAATKTQRANRTLRLGEAAKAVLREHRRRQGTIDPDAFVFATRLGRPLHSSNVTKDLHAALARAGLPRQRFHDLRHLYATLMLEGGEELAVISRMLGHANITTTANVYAHLTREMHDRTAARMDAILAQPAGVAAG